jgi:uncharacterized SAM-binding protein YcdF (DUF218 family)
MYYNLGISTNTLEKNPDYIVVLGGGGMPSESGLMRTYFASKTAKQFPNSKLIVALPGNTTDTTSAIFLMKKELIERGVNGNRILFEPIGTNTRSQALEIKKLINIDNNILIISSPEHMYRAVKTFIKVGFKQTGGKPAFEKAIESNLSFEDDTLGGNNIGPSIGDNTQLRYQFWNHMKYQIIVYREYLAIVYYKLKSWI